MYNTENIKSLSLFVLFVMSISLKDQVHFRGITADETGIQINSCL
jgi:hypothetical protein